MTPTFRPPRWLRNGHVQTILGAAPHGLGPSNDPGAGSRIAVAVDGGEISVVADIPSRTKRPLVVIVHGIGGSSESYYAQRAARAFRNHGYHTVRYNMRGAGAEFARAPSMYHAALWQDLGATVDTLSARAEVGDVFVLGYSLGGALSLHLAANAGALAKPPRAVASISAPVDLAVVTRHLETWRTFLYRRHIVQALVAQSRAFAAAKGRVPYDVARIGSVRTIRDYDETVVVPTHGFESADRYYAQASAKNVLPSIAVPTLMVHAEDDPMVPGWSVRPWLGNRSPLVDIAWTDRGGHVAAFEGLSEHAFLETHPVRAARAFFDQRRTDA